MAWLLLLSSTWAAVAQPGWLPGFHQPGLTGEVRAVLPLPNGELIVGGNFTNVGGHPNADYVVRWDGSHWQPLGEGPGTFTEIKALCALPAGGLVAAGTVVDSANGFHSVITRWDGHHWQPLGNWPTGYATTLTIAPNGDVLAGFLYGSGHPCEVLRWDGQRWQPLATNAATAAYAERRVSIWKLVVTATGDLVAYGNFPFETHELRTVAHWTGTAWQPLGPAGVHRSAVALELTPQGEALAGGELFDAHGNSSNYIARWDGRAWQDLGPGLKGRVETLVVTPAGEVQATTVTFNGGIDTKRTIVQQWNGSAWQVIDWQTYQAAASSLSSRKYWGADTAPGWPSGSLPAGFAAATAFVGGGVTALAAARNGDVLLAGNFLDADAVGSTSYVQQTRIYRWNGQYRRGLGSGFAGRVTALAVAPNGDVLAAGTFAIANGPDSIRHIARWNGHHWQPLGHGLPAAPRAMAVAPNGDVLAGGDFGIRRWDGRHWQPLPLPRPFPADGAEDLSDPSYLGALAVAPNGDVVAAGHFVGYAPREHAAVMRWDGRRWHLLVGNHADSFIQCLAVAAGGKSVVGTGATGQVHEFRSESGTVVHFDPASDDGWGYSPTSFDGYVNAVAIAANGDIIAGGDFSHAAGLPARNLVRWHAGAWQALGGSGLNGPVHAVVVAPNGDIVVGGQFTATGDGAQSLGQWGIYRDR
ncbi:WD40 repeat domain-containing protein [Hymenobacter properus]|uniref:Uncharacterized protein n=1 Tax=Hymenobacter properus TaxID=2791026 RepID=A0A931FLG9_9BACT|nr:hypothetical protein [Hymenobacter properus]MBF9144193.1 hypothetical protein [Hymenobacter properus]MBR7723011.1 hypothetical protein [Microvirga sp. SRT04]